MLRAPSQKGFIFEVDFSEFRPKFTGPRQFPDRHYLEPRPFFSADFETRMKKEERGPFCHA